MDRFPRLRALFVMAAFAVPLAGASELPDLGEASRAVLSSQQERRLGEAIMREVRADRAYADDAESNAYLDALGYRLAAHSPDARIGFEFFLMQDPAINAFALPGGFIGVHSGLIVAAQTESELASVLAHEIAHVTQGHIARMVAGQQQAQLGSLLAMGVALLAARSNPQAAPGLLAGAQAAAIQSQLNFTRDMERDADRVGLAILERSGFDARAMAAFFERLQRATRLADSSLPAYLRTHPITSERIADALNRVDALPYRQVREDPDFQLLRERLRAMEGAPVDAVRLYETRLRERTYASEAAQRYGLVLALARQREWPRARQELARLRDLAPGRAMVAALEGDVLVGAGDLEGARAHYPRALAAHPGYRPLVYDYAELLLRLRRPAEVLALTRERLQVYPNDHRLHALQARAHALTGRVLAQNRAQAEASVLLGNLPLAVEQLQAGLKVGDGDFFELSAAEARLRELRARVAEARKG